MDYKFYNPASHKGNTRILLLTFFVFICNNFFPQAETTIEKTHKYWAKERNYVYEVVYHDSLDKILSRETLTLQPTEEVWKIDSKQTLLTFLINYTESDSALLFQNPQNGVKRSWYHKFQEGAIEDEKRIWMHPLRQNQYVLAEIAPFPEVKFPLEINHTWESKLEIYQGFGTFYGDVKSKYTVEGKEARRYKFGTLACWKIDSESEHNKLGKNKAVFYFNQELGFTEMNYWFYNRYKISIKIIDFK